jgi:SNF2 family DNA or RNA helicase
MSVTLRDFIEKYGRALGEKIERILTPVYIPGSEDPSVVEYEKKMQHLLRKPFPVQAEIVKGLSKALYKAGRKKLYLVGEMGTGKTMIALSTIYMAPEPLRVLVVCPGHLVEKWLREARITIPGIKTVDLAVKNCMSLLEGLRYSGKPEVPEVWVISKERVKLGYGWKPAYQIRKTYSVSRRQVYTRIACPDCYRTPMQQEVPLTEGDLNRKRHFCSVCGSALWQAVPQPRRYSPAEYIKRYLRGRFDMIVLDEVHDYKAGDTLQGRAMGVLLNCSRYFLGLTGTINGGYADNLFYLLYRVEPTRLMYDGFNYRDVSKWQQKYGVEEHVIKLDDTEDYRYGRQRKNAAIVKKRPGVAPEVVGRYFLDKSCFIRLQDVIEGLPPYDEYVVSVKMDEPQASEYNRLESLLRGAVQEYGMIAMASMLQALLSYPDSCVEYPEDIEITEKTIDPITGKKVVTQVLLHITAPRIPNTNLLPKERELIRICREEKAQGRKVLVYLAFTGTRDIRERIKKVLEDNRFRVCILPETVEPKRRERWISAHAGQVDVLITNPELVKVGLDLVEFPTVVFYQTGYNIFTLRQAARRSWRIGQPKPVKVYFLCYQDTMQETAISLIARKLEVALMVEGDLPEGLANYQVEGGSLLEEMAKALAEGRRYTGAEAAWASFRKKEVEAQLGISDGETVFSEQSLKKVSRVPEATTTVSENTVIKVSVYEGRKKKVSRLEIRHGELEDVLKGKVAQFELF